MQQKDALTRLSCYHFSLSAVALAIVTLTNNLFDFGKPGVMDVVTDKMCSMLMGAEQLNGWDQMMKINQVCPMKIHLELDAMVGMMMDPHLAVPMSLFLSTNLCSMVELWKAAR
jgi:hypothetical protein